MIRRFLLGLLLSLAVLSTPHLRAAGTYNVTLTPTSVSTRANQTGTVISMMAAGDLRGLLTIDLDPDATHGKWTLLAAYVENVDPDGITVVNPAHHIDDGAPHDDFIRHVNNGALVGTVTGATLATDPATGRPVLTGAQLVVSRGDATFAGAQGFGAITATTLPDGTVTTTLTLTF